MSYVNITLAKQHLLITGSDDDVILQQCIDAAEAYCAAFMGRPNISDNQHCGWIGGNDCVSSSEQAPGVVPASVVQAVLMMTAEYFENRLPGIVGTIYTESPVVRNLLWQHRVGLGV